MRCSNITPYLRRYASVGKQLPLYMYPVHYVYTHHDHFCPFPKTGPGKFQSDRFDECHL